MTKIYALTLAALLFPLTARAEGFWHPPSTGEIVVHVATETLLLADMLQTLDIKNHPTYRESNFIIGSKPSDGAIVGYFASTIALSTLVWYVAPPIARYFVDAPLVYFELPIVINNQSQWGLKMRLPF